MSAADLDPSAAEIVGREFDAAHYQAQLAQPVDDPLRHYLERGWAEGLDPSPEFESRFYLRANPDVAAARIDPFLHYLTEGRDQGRAPTPQAMNERVMRMDGAFDMLTPFLDPLFYLDQCPSLKGATINPVQHYLTYGWKLGFDPAPDFSNSFYLSRSPDVARAGMSPFHHYVGWGRHEGRLGHPDAMAREKAETDEGHIIVAAAFDRDFYFLRHPDLADNHVDPVLHYMAFGAGQGFDPAPWFSTRWYLERSPDVAAAGMNPFYHYLVWGKVEGRSPSPAAPLDLFGPESSEEMLVAREFDPDFYRTRNPATAATHVVPVKHFLRYGWRAGADPSAAFSTRFYLAQDPALTDGVEDPLHHYLRVGRAAGRLPQSPLAAPEAHYPLPELAFLESELVAETIRPEFDADFYAEANPEVAAGGIDPVWDYVFEGWRAGRDPAPWFSTGDYLSRYPDVAVCRYNPFFHYLIWGREHGFSPARDPASGVPALLVASSRSVRAPDLRETAPSLRASSVPFGEETPTRPPSLDPGRLDLHWVVPDIDGPGRGGLTTLLRVVRRLELFGHRCTLWVLDPDYDRPMRTRVELLIRDYPLVRAEIRLLSDEMVFPDQAVLVATSWPTAHRVKAARGGAMAAYFVQDDESDFYPAGSRALAADQTYGFDLAYLCAGPWLAEQLAARGRWVRAFSLAADERYRRAERRREANAPPRIAFYARASTARRSVELGLLALEVLAARGVGFHVDLFGEETSLPEAPYSAASHGVLDQEALAALYAQCDVGLCFSATNHSLVPQEMMASGLPVVELDGAGGRAVYPEGVVTMASPDPERLADAVAGLLHDQAAREAQAQHAAAWVAGFSWDVSARAVEAALLERAAERGLTLTPSARTPNPGPKASVIIPTYNGGERFKAVLARVLEQAAPFAFEIVVVDSSSDDGTWEHLEAQSPQLRRIRIDKADFQHGRTRNFAAGLAEGEHLAFLTQDALPADAHWLYDLVSTLERFPLAAGAFGRHRALPEASPFVRRGIDTHFADLDGRGIETFKWLDLALYRSRDEGFRRFLHFFSSNNALIRRSVWARHPLPEIDYGEDQAWAARVIDEGYSKVYAPQAAVIHSHDYTEAEMFERARTDTRFQLRTFGYRVAPDEPERQVRRMNAGDRAWGVQHGISAEQIEAKMRLNAAEVAGMVAAAAETA